MGHPKLLWRTFILSKLNSSISTINNFDMGYQGKKNIPKMNKIYFIELKGSIVGKINIILMMNRVL